VKRKQLILVVDDDQEILRMLNRILELEGYDVALAANGRTALALVEECEPDLVILDIIMPELDGFQVLDLIRQRSDIPVIMLTVRCEETTLHNALILGADDYMSKPFRISELLTCIRAKLRGAVPGATTSASPALTTFRTETGNK